MDGGNIDRTVESPQACSWQTKRFIWSFVYTLYCTWQEFVVIPLNTVSWSFYLHIGSLENSFYSFIKGLKTTIFQRLNIIYIFILCNKGNWSTSWCGWWPMIVYRRAIFANIQSITAIMQIHAASLIIFLHKNSVSLSWCQPVHREDTQLKVQR